MAFTFATEAVPFFFSLSVVVFFFSFLSSSHAPFAAGLLFRGSEIAIGRAGDKNVGRCVTVGKLLRIFSCKYGLGIFRIFFRRVIFLVLVARSDRSVRRLKCSRLFNAKCRFM